MLEVYRLEERGGFGDRTLQLFHGGWLKLSSDRGGIQLTAESAVTLAEALLEWSTGERTLLNE